MIRSFLVLAAAFTVGCSQPAPAPVRDAAEAYIPTFAEVDSARVLADLYFLSSPALEGRATGTPGNAAARAYIQTEMMAAGLDPFEGRWVRTFEVEPGVMGSNVVGFLRGTESPDRYIVVSAHYDHLGVRGGEIYPGADDNASGAAALLEIARYFGANPPEKSIIFAAFDAEELGLRGARAFVANPPVPLDSILLDINMDMVGRNAAGELYVAGTYEYPFLLPLVDTVAARSDISLLAGHDRPDLSPGDDWTMLSDQGAFQAVGIPFAYFGVEDHPDYHQPTDTFEHIVPGFFVNAVRTVLDFVREADAFSYSSRAERQS